MPDIERGTESHEQMEWACLDERPERRPVSNYGPAAAPCRRDAWAAVGAED
jgi:hypothetical protein